MCLCLLEVLQRQSQDQACYCQKKKRSKCKYMLTCSPFNFMDHSKKLIISRLLETYYLTEFANDEMCEYNASKQIRSRTALLLAVAVCAYLFPQFRENLFYRTKGQHRFSCISLPLSPSDSLSLPLSSSFFCFVFFSLCLFLSPLFFH
jgi:hypothetical protein